MNPAARRAGRVHEAVLRAFRAAGVRVERVCTARPGHAAELAAARADTCPAVFVLAGDGTVMEVVGALAGSGVPVGVIPGGTGNLVAHALGVPFGPARAVARLLGAQPRVTDLGVLDSGRYFAFAAGVGVDARMIAETSAAAKRRFGVGAYALTAARAAAECRTFEACVEVDGERLERRAAMAMLANFGSVLGGWLTLGPGICADDGLLDLCLFSPDHVGHAAGIAWQLVRRRFSDRGRAIFRPGRSFRITCDPAQPYQADGEMLGTTPFEARVAPGAATFLAPVWRD